MPYMGTSAGSNVACPTLQTTNDMPIVEPPEFSSLNLVPFQINPHYIDPDPGSAHMGETRDVRLAEFHEENAAPVVGLREGAMLKIDGDSMRILGGPGGKLFRRGQEPVPLQAGSQLDFLLNPG
jgi:dipeptidase E